MAWGFGNDKRARFEASQIKKSINAGLIRMPADDEVVISSDFKGTFELFIDRQMSYSSFSDSVKLARKEGLETAIQMFHSGSLKLASGEEIRRYVPMVFGQGK